MTTTDTGRFDIAAATRRLAATQARPGQPGALFAAFDALCAEAVGHRLFTLLARTADGTHVARVYSSRPAEYPTSAKKPMGRTPWGARLLERGEAWFGQTPADIREAFFDHELIASLGGEAILNAPVRWDGAVLGVVSVVGPEGAYTDADLTGLELIAQALAPGFLALEYGAD